MPKGIKHALQPQILDSQAGATTSDIIPSLPFYLPWGQNAR